MNIKESSQQTSEIQKRQFEQNIWRVEQIQGARTIIKNSRLKKQTISAIIFDGEILKHNNLAAQDVFRLISHQFCFNL